MQNIILEFDKFGIQSMAISNFGSGLLRAITILTTEEGKDIRDEILGNYARRRTARKTLSSGLK
jgi:hypothetical protein